MQFDYLIPPKDVYNIKHDEFYIKHGEGNKHVRKIFYNVKYDEFEEEQINKFEEMVKQENIQLPHDQSSSWDRGKSLKFCYTGSFTTNKIKEKVLKHLEWIKNEQMQALNPIAEDYLKKGYLYTFGRDEQYRPILYIQMHLVTKLKLNIDQILCASSYVGQIIQKNMFVPGYVENWIAVLDFNGQGLLDTSLSTLQKINETLSINFTCSLHKMFILNPSYLFNATWKILQRILHPETAAKIQFLKSTQLSTLQDYIPKKQIEEKYGGSHENLVSYWPIVNSLEEKQENQMPQKVEHISSVRESEYYSLDNESKDFFKKQSSMNLRYQEQINEQFESMDEQQSKFEEFNGVVGHQGCCKCVLM